MTHNQQTSVAKTHNNLVSATPIPSAFDHFHEVDEIISWKKNAKHPFSYVAQRGNFAFDPLKDILDGDRVLCVSLDNEHYKKVSPETWTFGFFNTQSLNLLEIDTYISFYNPHSEESAGVNILIRAIMPVLLQAIQTGVLEVLVLGGASPLLARFPYTVGKDIELEAALFNARCYVPHEEHSIEELESLYLYGSSYPCQRLNIRTMNVHYLFENGIYSDDGIRYIDDDFGWE